ncbi:MAG: uroporphyrin-III methyltransferase [Methylibium sp. NZG]|nr:MAG: uroporphyrin-III methyltransferase [Methylibium sp. NZG]
MNRGPWVAVAAGLFVLAALGLGLAWKADQRIGSLEQELVKRQMDSAGQATEARVLAKAAEEGMREMAAKLALTESRVAEVAIQRSQLEELLQSLSRSRDENVVVDIEASIRVALQQNAITGSAEPLVATLKQSDERLARYNQPRLEGVRRAITRDLDRVKAVSVTDIFTLTIKLDDVVRMVDELPLLSAAEPRGRPAGAVRPLAEGAAAAAAAVTPAGTSGTTAATSATATTAPRTPPPGIGTLAWFRDLGAGWDAFWQGVWLEVKSLVRVTRIDQPDAMLLAPEQAFFLKENLKLRLLNARLALLSRQFETAQADLKVAQASLDRYFDKTARRTVQAADLIKQVATQARQVGVPRPDDTLAALAAAGAGR